MRSRLRRIVERAAAVDPAVWSVKTSASRISSLAYAISGCFYMLRRQRNMRIIALATVAAVTASLWLELDGIEWSVIALAIALVWITEFINAAVEAAVNLGSSDYHPMAKVAKDVAAGAVLLASIAALAIGLQILGPPLLEKLRTGTA